MLDTEQCSRCSSLLVRQLVHMLFLDATGTNVECRSSPVRLLLLNVQRTSPCHHHVGGACVRTRTRAIDGRGTLKQNGARGGRSGRQNFLCHFNGNELVKNPHGMVVQALVKNRAYCCRSMKFRMLVLKDMRIKVGARPPDRPGFTVVEKEGFTIGVQHTVCSAQI